MCGLIHTPYTNSRQLILITPLILVLWLGALPGWAQTASAGQPGTPCINTNEIRALADDIASSIGAPDSYDQVVKAAFETPKGTTMRMTAFEENPSFVYAVAAMESREEGKANGPKPGTTSRWVRRVIILNPSTFVIEDESLTLGSSAIIPVCIASAAAPQVSGNQARVGEDKGEISAQVLFPANTPYHVDQTGTGKDGAHYLLKMTVPGASPETRTVQVLQVGKGSESGGGVQSGSTPGTRDLKLTITAGGQVFHLNLPPPSHGAGEIEIATLDGKATLASRPFPSGVLPHGPQGNRLMERWDSAYRHQGPAPWDIGRPADELQKVIASGKVAKCRVVDLCCGSGTDAVYLAKQGFDVTGVDVSPTALAQARQKAQEAKVSVNWVLADILAPPDLKPFDFVYDRACYHVVRQQSQGAYIETVKRLSHPGTSFLLLSARKDDPLAEGGWGVTEEELRADFLNLFTLEWLRPITLETSRPGFEPPAWSAFMKRKPAN